MDGQNKKALEEISQSMGMPVAELEKKLENSGKEIYLSTQLSIWMDKNFDDIFEVAPADADYAVGVVDIENPGKKPVIHYFKSKYDKKNLFGKVKSEGALDLMQKERISCINYRHQCEMEFL